MIGKGIWVLLFVSLAACGSDAISEPVPNPALIHLIVQPEHYDGQRVSVRGFVRVRPHYQSGHIFMGCDDLLNDGQGLLLRIPNETLGVDEGEQFDGRYVSLTGVFEYPIVIDAVEVIELLEDETILRPSCFD